ncbi:MAG: class I SAM-dependent methyltransferase [Clostridia bacterium]|nr:class I SAM-dependent methyltransferase [Clostridia bacterium]
MNEPYYKAYEKRYQAVFSAGAERWGHSPDDEVLYNTLKSWVEENNLQGKSIIEYACGEGACGVILSELGCIYHGVDISPSAIEKSKKLLQAYPNATVDVFDMVKESAAEKYDAALDCMGFHMLVTDNDRNCYLKNAYDSLKENAPMLFFRESYRQNGTYQGVVHTLAEWEQITGEDYKTLQLRQVRNSDEGGIVEVLVPLLPARAKDKTGYVEEFENIGFDVEKFIEMDSSTAIPHSASIYVRKIKR